MSEVGIQRRVSPCARITRADRHRPLGTQRHTHTKLRKSPRTRAPVMEPASSCIAEADSHRHLQPFCFSSLLFRDPPCKPLALVGLLVRSRRRI